MGNLLHQFDGLAGDILISASGTHVHNFPDPAWFFCRRTKQAVGAVTKGKRDEWRNSC